jgi:predicted MPP superfamily phosphohydrolase
MSLFFISFILIYGGAHLYAFLKTRAAFPENRKLLTLLAVFFALMISAPFFVRIYEKNGFETFAYLTAHVGYVWMGIIFLFFTYSLLIDLYRFLLLIVKIVIRKKLSFLTPSVKFCFVASMIISLSIASYGYFEARNIRIENVTVRSSKIPEEIGSIRIVQISDVHLGHIVRKGRLNLILNNVKAGEPDILVSTGDLINGQRSDIGELLKMFEEIKPTYGKFAITGNHEFYAGVEESVILTEKAGFTVLRNEGQTVSGLINIAGVDDPAGIRFGIFSGISDREILAKLPSDKFTLFLKHRSIVEEGSEGLFNLQLSGHTHKGQIFPFNYLVQISYPMMEGFYNVSEVSSVYVNRGSGTWGPPIRFLAPPEVTVIELVHE